MPSFFKCTKHLFSSLADSSDIYSVGFSYFRAVSELLTYDETQAHDIEKASHL